MFEGVGNWKFETRFAVVSFIGRAAIIVIRKEDRPIIRCIPRPRLVDSRDLLPFDVVPDVTDVERNKIATLVVVGIKTLSSVNFMQI